MTLRRRFGQSSFLALIALFAGAGAALAQTPSVTGVVDLNQNPTPAVAGSTMGVLGTNLGPSSAVNAPNQPEASLGGTTVSVGGYTAWLFRASSTVLFIQIPWEVAGLSSTSLTVTTAGGTSSSFPVNLAAHEPTLFPTGNGYGFVVNPNGTQNSASNPTVPGAIVQIGADGLGPVEQQQTDGAAPSGNTNITNPVSVTIGGVPAPFISAQLCNPNEDCPAANASYLITVVVPNVAGSALPVIVTEGSSTSNSAAINVASQSLTINSGPNFGDFQMGPVEIPLQASGGTGTGYTWSVVSGSLPTGIALRIDGGPNYFPTGVSTGLLGVATTPGPSTFTLQVTDSANNTFTLENCTINILSLAITDPTNFTDGFVGSSYSYSPTVVGSTGTVTWSSGSLPAGLTLDSSGTISGTPTAPGNYGFSLSASDSTGTTTRFYNLSVFGVGISNSGDLGVFTQGSTVNITLNGAGGTPPYTFSGGGLPSGLSMSTSGVISGTLTGGNGTFRFNVGINDHAGNSYNKSFVMNLVSVPTLPSMNYPNPAEYLTVGESRNYQFRVNGGTPPYTWTITDGTIPAGMRLLTSNVPNNFNLGPDDALLTGVPTAAPPGGGTQQSYPFTVNVTDSSPTPVTVSQQITLIETVLDINYPANPVLGQPYSGYIQPFGGVNHAYMGTYGWTLLSGALPSGLALDTTNGYVTGTPTSSSNFNTFIEFQCCAGLDTIERFVDFNVQSPTNPQILINNTNLWSNGATGQTSLPDATVNFQYNYNLSACCTPNGGTFSATGLPNGLTMSGNGQISGTPTQAGQFTVTVTNTDNGNANNTGVAIFLLNVTPLQVNISTPTGNVGKPYTNGSLSITSGNSGTVTWTLVAVSSAMPPGVTLNSNGAFSGTPTSAGQFNGQAIASDTAGHTFRAFFGIEIYPASTLPPPGFNFGSNILNPLGEVQFALGANGGNGTYTWNIVNGSLPPGISLRTDPPFPPYFNGVTAGLIGVATVPGNYPFTISVTSAGQTSYQYCTWRITPLNVMDGYNLPQAFVGTAINYTFTPLNTTGGFTFTAVEGFPSWLSLSSAGVLSGTPPTGSAGTYNLQYQLASNGDTIGRGINLNVSALQFTTAAQLGNVAQNQAVNINFGASGGSGGYQFTANGLPGGLSMSSSGLLSGNISPGVGRYGFQVTVKDSSQNSYTQMFSLTEMGDPPLLPNINLNGLAYYPVTPIGGYMSWEVAVTNGGTAPFTWNVTGLPPGVAFRQTNTDINNFIQDDVEIWGTPTSLGGNPYTVTYTVTDANGLSASLTYPMYISTLTVDGNNFPPNGTVGVAYSTQLKVLGGTAPYSVNQIEPGLNPLPDGLTLNGFTLSGTPLENGNFNPDFNFQDSAGNGFVMLSGFNIASATSPQININNSSYLGSALIGQQFNFQFNACCDSSGTFNWSIAGGNPPAQLTLSSTGQLSGVLSASAGKYQFLVKADDPNNPSNAGYKQFTLIATPIALQNVGTDDNDAFGNLPYGNVGQLYNYQIPFTGANGAVTVAKLPGGALPPGITYSSGGLLNGTPTASGQFQFGLAFTDSANNFATEYFQLAIYPNNTAPPPSFDFNGNFGTWQLGEIEYALNASGGNGTYTWAVFSGALPTGLALRTDVPSNFNGASAGLMGVATTPGNYTFTLALTSGGQTSYLDCTWRITALNVMDGFNLPQAYVGTVFNYTLTPINATGGATFAATNNSLPSWLSLSPAGVLTGTPPTGSAGSYNINYTVSSNGDTINRNINLHVSALQFTSSQMLPNAAQNGTVDTNFTASGGSGSYTFSANGLPCCLSLSSVGTLTGVLQTGSGPFDFNVTVTDANNSNLSFTQVFMIDVLADPPLQPEVSLDGLNFNPVITIGNYSSWGVNVNNGGVAPYTWTVTGLPPGMSYRSSQADFTLSPNGVDIYGVPTSLNGGQPYNVTYTATDANGLTASITAPLSISALTVDGSSFPQNGTLGTAYSQQFRVLGGTGPYTVTLLNPVTNPLPDGLTLNGLLLSGTPLENGGFNPDFLCQDSAGNSFVMLTGFQIASPTSPTININSGSYLGAATIGQQYNFNFNACCSASGNYTWSVAGGSLPGGLSLNGNALSGTPNSGTAGMYQFLLKATDPSQTGNSGYKQFTLYVIPFNLTNSGTDNNDYFGNLPYGNVNTLYNYQIPASSGAGALTFTLLTGNILPPGISLSSNGLLNGTPTASGQFNFAATVQGGNNSSYIQYFNLAIYPGSIGPPPGISNGSNLGTSSIGEVQIPLSAAGGNGTYIWSVAAGSTLPPGLSLRTDQLPGYFPSSASASIAGVATVPSSTPYTFSLTVTSGSQSTTQSFTLKISALTAMEDYGYRVPDAFVGVPYPGYTITPLNNAGTVTYSNISGVPNGMSFVNGVLSGTPTASGYYNINFAINDTVDTVGIGISLSVTTVSVSATGVTGAILPNVTQGTAYNQVFTGSGGTAPYTFTANGLPNGLSLSSSGTVSGTVTGGPGRYGFTVTATDSNHLSYTRNFALDVIGVPITLPTIGTYGNFDDCSLGITCVRPLYTINGGTAPFTWTITGLPPGMNYRPGSLITDITPMDVELWGTPTQLGTFNVTAVVTDVNGLSATQTFPLIVSPLFADYNDYLPNGTLGTAYSQLLRVLGGTLNSSAPLDSAQVTLGVLPDGLTLSGLTVSGTPLVNGGFSPRFTFTDHAGNTVHITEGFGIGDSGSNTITLNSYNFDTNGSTTNIIGYFAAGSSVNFGIGGCGDCTWSIPAGGGALPTGLTLNPSNGNISGTISSSITPFGAYTFLVEANASGNTGYQQYTIYVVPAALNITNSNPLPYASLHVSYSQQLSSSSAVSFALAPGSLLPPGLGLSTAGVLSGTPSATGQYGFDVVATDASGNVLIRQFTLNVWTTSPPLSLGTGPTLGSATSPLTPGGENFQLNAAGGTGPYTYSLTPGSTLPPNYRIQNGGQLPSGFSLTGGTGGLIGLVYASGNHTYNFSLRVTDSLGVTFDRPITMYTTDLTIPNSNSPPAAYIGTAYSFTFLGNGGSGTYTWSASGLPSGLSMSSAGVISGTPSSGDAVSNNITVTLQDSNGITENFGYTLTVYPYNITTGSELTGTIGVAFGQTLAAGSGCTSPCTWSIKSGSLPSGLSLTSSTGAITGSPTGEYYGAITVQASSGSLAAQKVITISVPFSTPQPIFFNGNTNLYSNGAGNSATYNFAFQGGTGPYTYTLTSGALPPGTSLFSGGDTQGFEFNPGFAYVIGRPMATGTYTFTIQATDTKGNTGSATYTWLISPMNFNLGSFPANGSAGTYGSNTQTIPPVYGQAYSQMIEVIGGTGTYNSWTTPVAANPLPPGLTVNSAGVVSGTPQVTGSFTTLFQATDSIGDVLEQYVTFTINASTTNTLTFGVGPGLGTFQSGGTYTFNLNPSGGTAPYTFAVPTVPAGNTLPPGCSVESGSGLLAGAPGTYVLYCAPLVSGAYSFILKVTDSAGNVGARLFTVNFSPVALENSTTLPNGSAGTNFSETLTTFDNSGGSVTWSVAAGSALPTGISLNGATLSGTPAAGTYSFTLTATDSATGIGINYTFSFTVSTITITTPSIVPMNLLFLQPYNSGNGYQFTSSGGSGTIQWSATGLPTGMSLSSAGLLTGTPTSPGFYTLTVKATDGISPVTKLCTVYVTYQTPSLLSYNIQAADALPDLYVGENFSDTIGGNVSGGMPPYIWTVPSGSTLPPGLNLLTGSTLPPNITPGSAVIAGEPTTAGQYTFALKITDSAGTSVTNTFSVNISNMGLLGGNLPVGGEGAAYAAQFTPIGGTPPYTFTYSQEGINTELLPPGLTASSTGLISGTATSTGNFGFNVTVTDHAGNHLTESYSLVVKAGSTGLEITTPIIFGPISGQALTNFSFAATGGTPPYTWNYPNTPLPPGLSFSGGSSGTLSGVPTTPGTYSYDIQVVDSKGVVADRIYPMQVLPMQIDYALSRVVPDVGTVGVPYSYQFKVDGGTGAVTFAENALYPLPPGLSLSSTGLLSGTPTQNGVFQLYATLTDAAGNFGYAQLEQVWIMPAGQTVPPAYGGQFGESHDASVGVAFSQQLGTTGFGATGPFHWSVYPGTSLPPGLTILPGANGVADYLAGIPTTAGSYTITLAGTDQHGQPLTSQIVSQNVSPMSVSPKLIPNGTVGTPYSATMTVSGGVLPYQNFNFTGASAFPPGLSVSFPGNSNSVQFSGTPTQAGYYSIQFTVTDNATPTANTITYNYNIVIDNDGNAQGIGLDQPDVVSLNYVIGPTSPSAIPITVTTTSTTPALNFVANTALVGVTGLSLTATSGTAPDVLGLNLNTASLTTPGVYAGVIAVASSTASNSYNSIPVVLTVTNPPPCTYTLIPTGGSLAAASGAGSFSVSTGSQCGWTATTAQGSFITVNANTLSGTGTGTVQFSVTANTASAARSDVVTITSDPAGQTQTYTVTQFGSACALSFTPTSVTATAAGGFVPVTITTTSSTCAWTASATSPLAFASGSATSGTGNGAISFTIPANTTANTVMLTGSVTLSGGTPQTFTVMEGGVNCVATLTASSAEIGYNGGSGQVGITLPSGCTYSTLPGPNWISITSGASGGSSGTLTFSLLTANSSTSSRSGNLTIGGTPFTITQDPTPCSVTIDASTSGSPFGVSGGDGTLNITANGPNCSWTSSSPATWVQVSPAYGSGMSGTVSLTVSNNSSSDTPRTATLTIAGQSVSVMQFGMNCNYTLSATSAQAPFGGGTGSVTVTTATGCMWTSSTDPTATWLTITSGGSGNGTGALVFNAGLNPTNVARSGTLTVAGQSFVVMQAAGPCTYILSANSTSIPNASTPGSFTFSTATSGCSAQAMSFANWLTVSTSSSGGGTSGTVNFTAAANPYGTTRTGTIEFASQTYTVTQTGASCSFSLNAYGQAFGQAGGGNTISAGPSVQTGCTLSAPGTNQPTIVNPLGPLQSPGNGSSVYSLPFTVVPYVSTVPGIRYATIAIGGQIFAIKQTSW